MFILKKIVSRLFFPLSLVLGIFLVGLLRSPKGKRWLWSGLLIFYLFSFYPFAFLLLWPLESQYQPVSEASLRKEIKWVVVLGGGSREAPWLPPEDRLYDSSLKRLLEGIRLFHRLPQARLILSGGDFRGNQPVARIMQDIALRYGLPPSRLVLEEASWDTHDEAILLKKVLGDDDFYLVTSAGHMPRSMALFKKAGTRPIAAPTDFLAVWESPGIIAFFPQAGALQKTEAAFYEYLGLLWRWVRQL